MANELKFGSKVVFLNGNPVTLPILASDPGSASTADMYYNSTSNKIRYYNGTAWADISAGAGTVTSVAFSDGSSTPIFSVSGSPVTTSGTLTQTLINQNANQIFAGPSTGAASQPAFRSLVAADLPSLAYANQALSNLNSTAINQSLLPQTDVTYDLGSDSFRWSQLHARYVVDSAGQIVIDFENRALEDASNAIQLSWSASGVELNQLTATTVPYLNAGKILTSSAVTPTELGYLSGVTSALQTQINGKLSLSGGTMSGNIAMGGNKLTGLSAGSTAGDSVRYEQAILASGVNAFSANQSMGGNKLTNLADPTSPQDAATKFYLDNAIAGLSWKAPARAASTANVSVASAPSSIDGVTLAANDRVLLKNQTAPAENGIYVFSAAAAPLVRATDMDSWNEVVASVLLTVEGSVNQGSKWVNTNISGGTLGTTAITFVAFSVAGTVNGTGTTNYVAYWSGSSTLTAEQFLAASRGGLAVDASAFSGIGHWASGVYSASPIVNADVSASAAIAYSKLNLAGSIVNADIAAGAAIAFSKLASLTSANILVGNGSNVATAVAVSGDITLSNAGVTAVAKIAGTTVSGTTGSGNVVFSASPSLSGTITAAAANFSGALGANGGITSSGSLLLNANAGASAINFESSSFGRSVDGTNFVTETYVDSTTLTDNSGPTAVAAFQFSVASFAGLEIAYVIETGTSNVDTRIGTLRITANSSGTIVPSISDMYSESADCGITWTATNTAGTISVKYTASNQGANRTMRADVKSLRR